jgi:rhodanese-related sulfurtransferase
MRQVTPQTLHSELQADSPPAVIDIRSDEHYEVEHITGAENFCVYEVVFMEEIQKKFPDKDTRLVIAGQNDDYNGAGKACSSLQSAGYTDIVSLTGGLDAWKRANYEVEGSGARTPAEQSLVIDTKDSSVVWIGRNPVNSHRGEISLKSGSVEIEGGCLVGGDVTLDMTEITCTDIQNEQANAGLIGHLKSDDFFSTDSFPEARMKLTNVTGIETAAAGSPNVICQGDLTLKGTTNAIEFEALATFHSGRFAFQAQIALDRTRWNILYGSGSVYEALGKHLVNDIITVEIQLLGPGNE